METRAEQPNISSGHVLGWNGSINTFVTPQETCQHNFRDTDVAIVSDYILSPTFARGDTWNVTGKFGTPVCKIYGLPSYERK